MLLFGAGLVSVFTERVDAFFFWEAEANPRSTSHIILWIQSVRWLSCFLKEGRV